MDSKEFGLVAAQQLFQIEDLHYGYWDDNVEVSLSNYKQAQKKYTEFLFNYIDKYIPNKSSSRILDVGCGVGLTTKKLLEFGYNVDGLVPSAWMSKYAKDIIGDLKNKDRGQIYESTFENFPISNNKKYDLIFFSESYQYINMEQAYKIIDKVSTANTKIIIFDFFRKDNIEGKSPLGGGHSIGNFYNITKNNNFKIVEDIDVTKNLSPNMKLVNDVIKDRVIPFTKTLDSFMLSRHRFIYKMIRFLLRKKIDKFKFKYSKERNEQNFIKFKTYRLLILDKH